MMIKELMTENPQAAQVNDPIMSVAKMMKDLNVGFMPILDSNKLVGVITDRDIVIRAIAGGMDFNTPVSDIMSTDLHVISPNDDVEDAADMMEEFQIRRLPVVDENNNLVGILSLGDIAVRMGDLEEAGEILEEISQPSRPEIAA